MIEPTWQSGDVSLYLGDCLEILPQLEAGGVDAVITDPPYGVNKDYHTYRDSTENLERLIGSFVPEVRRIAPVVAITCGVGNIYRYPVADWILCWHWKNTTSTGKWGFNCWQPIIVYGSDPQLKAGKGRHQDAKQFSPYSGNIGDYEHPCPKPEAVMRWIAIRCSLEKSTILDPFMGSGTTGVACVQTGRRFIGIEIDPKYFDIAVKRISQAQLQIRMPI